MAHFDFLHQEAQFPIGLVVSRFNQKVTQALHDSAITRLTECGFKDKQVTCIWVPGVVEIPFTLQRLAKSTQFQALIALGAVIRGETTHYDYVCEQVSQGCQRVALDYDIPVVFGVLTAENVEQAMARAGGAHSDKGRDAVNCAMEMVLATDAIEQLT